LECGGQIDLITRAHVKEYFELVDITQLSEEQDDRHALYAM
jgi:hypothetical protein